MNTSLTYRGQTEKKNLNSKVKGHVVTRTSASSEEADAYVVGGSDGTRRRDRKCVGGRGLSISQASVPIRHQLAAQWDTVLVVPTTLFVVVELHLHLKLIPKLNIFTLI